MATTFSMKRRVQFAETDLAGVLHFANYYRMMEEVEHAFWRSQELSVITQDGVRHISWPRVSTRCEHFAPARFEDELDLVLRVAQVGETSVTYEVEFLLRGERIALGSCSAVCCEVTSGGFEPVAIPTHLRKKLIEQPVKK